MKNPIENIILDKDKPVYHTEIDKQREEILKSDFVNAAIKAKKERREYVIGLPFGAYFLRVARKKRVERNGNGY